jgi:nucleotide-binding universal stress UspA family protein
MLIPLDGSPLADQALPYAERLATAAHSQLVVLRAVRDTDEQAKARTGLHEHVGRVRHLEPVPLLEAEVGNPADVIVAQARQQGAGLIVMGTHGRSGLGRWIYGSVADNVLRHTSVPVLLVPPHAATWPADRPLRLLLALNGTDLAAAALAPARQLAHMLEASIILVGAARVPSRLASGQVYTHPEDEPTVQSLEASLNDAAARLRTTAGDVEVRIEIDDPVRAITRVAREEGADLIAMATHGRAGMARFVLGSVATGVVRHATTAVLLVRPSAVTLAPADA